MRGGGGGERVEAPSLFGPSGEVRVESGWVAKGSKSEYTEKYITEVWEGFPGERGFYFARCMVVDNLSHPHEIVCHYFYGISISTAVSGSLG